MARPGPSVRLLLAALLLGASFPARADEAEAPVPAPKADPRKEALNRKEQVAKACDAEALEIRLLDVAGPPRKGEPMPGSSEKRGKDAESIANSIGAGVESEADDAGQTLSRKRGKTTKAKCRADVGRVLSRYPGATVMPTTEERVEILRQRRDALIPEGLRKKPEDVGAASKLFDGGMFGKLSGQKSDGAVAASPAASPFGSIRPVSYAADRQLPGSQLPRQYRGALTSPPPQAVSYSAPTFTQRAWQSVTGAYEASTAYVSESLDEAGQWVSGVARSVRNRFYSGIEMIQGFGYKFIHAGRQTNWGTKPLVDGLRRIAAYMRGTGKAETDLAVGDISSANGGQLGGHASHQTGRDVDIGFYMTDAASGKAADTLNFVRFTGGRDGLTGNNNGRPVRFDAERNWMLVQAILANPDPAFKPTHIFIANHLKAAVLAAGANAPERGRAAALMSYWPGHDNHLHLRVQ
jgi:hypothetical protein